MKSTEYRCPTWCTGWRRAEGLSEEHTLLGQSLQIGRGHGVSHGLEDHDPVMVLARRGDAVMFHNLTMHAGGAMKSGRRRPSLFQSYRSAWAAPLGKIPEWPDEVVRRSPPELRRPLEGLNDGLRVDIHGILQS